MSINGIDRIDRTELEEPSLGETRYTDALNIAIEDIGRHIPVRDTRTYKIVMLGSSNVGKTSLVARYMKNCFDTYSDSTIGASFSVKRNITTCGVIQLNIWDTAGQERYESLIPMYYRGLDIGIVVFDLTNRESFNRAKRWVETIENENAYIVLVGNKNDYGDSHIIRQLKDGRDYAEEHDIDFLTTSAKSGDGVIDLFNNCIIKKLEMEPIDAMDPASSNGTGDGHVVLSDEPRSLTTRCCSLIPFRV